jgi:uncharacterized SAM-binding protein YcdF (DUF218 family)
MGATILKIKKFLLYIIILFLIPFSLLQFLVISNQNNYEPIKSDVIIILGHSLEDGTIPSSWLVERLNIGLELYNLGYSNKIIVTGGMGKNDTIPVAISMQIWLIEHGVPITDIIAETSARNTFENFKYSKLLSNNHNLQSVIVVTNDFHMYRSMLIANNFYENISGKSAFVSFNFRKLIAYFKEPLSIVKYNFIK